MTPPLFELAILMGFPGAGKSTFYERRLATTHEQVSMDALPRSAATRRRQRELVAAALAAGRAVVVDNVNGTIAERAELVALAGAAEAPVVGYWLDAPARACLGRNARREGRARVPPVAIFAAAKRFQPPTVAEGFTALWRVRLIGSADVPDFELAPVA